MEDPNFVDLPPVEQVMRGKELLNMLQVPAQPLLAQMSARPEPFRAAGRGEVQMIVKRTFIELVAPAAQPARPRAVSDSALTHTVLNTKSSGGNPQTLAEMSEASTDDTSDHEEAASPPWSIEVDGGNWVVPQELYGMPAMPAACMTPMMPQGMAAMPGMWMQAGFQESSGYYPYPAVPMDPMMPWQWAYVDPYSGTSDAAQAFELPQQTPSTGSSSSRDHKAAGASERQEPAGPKTTVLLRNLPSDFTRSSLLELLEDEGFEGTFDFIYLPMDFGAKVCLGYAFVNFVSGGDALRCWEIFSGYSDWNGDKACEVTWGEPCQGLQAHIERYRNSPVLHKSIPEEWKPLIFKDGARVPFPLPTKSISAPKLRRRAGRDE